MARVTAPADHAEGLGGGKQTAPGDHGDRLLRKPGMKKKGVSGQCPKWVKMTGLPM